MKMDADVDIDFPDRNQILKIIKHTPARQESNNGTKHHNSGVYVTDIPRDPVHECSGIDYKEAEQRGYFKIDFLNVNLYQNIRDVEHYNSLLSQEPPWELLLDEEYSNKIIHIGNHHSTLLQMKPDNIPKMAMFLALIRPGKRYLIGRSWEEVSKEIWIKPSGDEYYFKKSHSLSYAVLVALHMNIIINQHHELM